MIIYMKISAPQKTQDYTPPSVFNVVISQIYFRHKKVIFTVFLSFTLKGLLNLLNTKSIH